MSSKPSRVAGHGAVRSSGTWRHASAGLCRRRRAAGRLRPLFWLPIYGPEHRLDEPAQGTTVGPLALPNAWSSFAGATDVRLGLVTNGEQWMFVDAPIGAVTSFASWYARLWGQEPLTLQAFINLLGIRRFFVDRSEQLPRSSTIRSKYQDEVTDALGEQVRRAVEVLMQALDRADVDRNRELLDGVEPAELYEAGLTVMMRIVFLLSAEERGLLLLGDDATKRITLFPHCGCSCARIRRNSRTPLGCLVPTISVFRAVYGGVDHEAMRLPALGGSLFDPDRFPFLEGRLKGSNWKIDAATPLPIDNRTVLFLLDAVQLFQGRTLSYLALDVEQIGYVYEACWNARSCGRRKLRLISTATKDAENPWVSLPELDDAARKVATPSRSCSRIRTGSSASRVRNDLAKAVDEASADKLLTACHGDRSLARSDKALFPSSAD